MGKFFKLALKIKELNTLDDLYHADKTVYENTVKQMQSNPNATIGKYFKDEKNNPFIFIDHRVPKNSKPARMLRRHELTHYIRDEKGLTTAKWANRPQFGLRSGIGTAVEEAAAGQKMFTNNLHASTKGRELISKYVYPVEAGISGLTGRSISFGPVRKLLKLIK